MTNFIALNDKSQMRFPHSNGTSVLGEVVFGAVDPYRPRSILELRSVLDVEEDEEELSMERLRDLDVRRRRRRKIAQRRKRTVTATGSEGPRDMG